MIAFCLLQCDRLTGGMQKLAEASEQLEELNAKLAVQKVAVTEKTASCEKLLAEISAGTTIAERKKEMAVEKGKEIEQQSKVIAVEKVSVQNRWDSYNALSFSGIKLLNVSEL